MSTHETHTPPENRSVTSLLSDLAREVTTLMRQELQLAKAEASEKVSQVEAGIGSLIAGGAVAFGGFLILLQFMVYGLADLLDEGYDIPQLWVSSLIVGLVVLLIGYFLLRKGQRDLKAKRLVPRRTAGSLRRDAELAKKEVHESRSRYHETY
ncbi:phage holin family protein [Nitrosococcus wardiae]|uniref:Phage holin family protein n=1 Tax=Nitrosococcus wardiae TaxID=1814290 RepID=A0A4V1AW85_9GAMM|nr:phage holin family protein [Nitrosococcus wardiae]QBQ55755.1 phage holin family protein [Nitrosococcus wardiae]